MPQLGLLMSPTCQRTASPNIFFFNGELSSGKDMVVGQKKRFKENLRVYLRDLSINIKSWETLASEASPGALMLHQESEEHGISCPASEAEMPDVESQGSQNQ